jgi:protein-tyrosine kinase
VSIIEQAARRLEELRRSGVEVPSRAGSAAADAKNMSIPALATRRLEELGIARQRTQAPVVHEIAPTPRPGGSSQSKPVQIDLARLAAMGYLTPDTPRAQIADEFRIVKRPLLTNVNGKSAAPVERANLIMVTSSLPGEGKTFVAINLAISMAMELDKSVLLIDADVSRPSMLSRLGLPPARGLLDVLADASLPLSDVMLRTNIDTLTLLPSGPARGRATEMLASEAMHHLLQDLATRYADRILIFDAPPLLPSTESRVLAAHMGQIIVVVASQHTPQKTVTQALATIESCPVVLPLLNKAQHSEVGSYYGYYGPNGN